LIYLFIQLFSYRSLRFGLFLKIQDVDGGHLENRQIGNDINDIADRSQFWQTGKNFELPKIENGLRTPS